MTVIVEDIRLVTVRPNDDVERRFCFEIISPGKSFLLQAESDDARTAWVKAIQVLLLVYTFLFPLINVSFVLPSYSVYGLRKLAAPESLSVLLVVVAACTQKVESITSPACYIHAAFVCCKFTSVFFRQCIQV